MAQSETSAQRPLPPWPRSALRLSVVAILFVLIALAAVAWVSSARQARGGEMAPGIGRLFGAAEMEPMGEDMRASGTAMPLPLFLSMWVTMMVAMMFPAVAPMVVAHWRLTYRRGRSPLGVVVFASGYLLAWAVIGVLAFALYRALLSFAPTLTARSASLLAGGFLVLAGAYQFTPLKSVCLKHCRSPWTSCPTGSRDWPGPLAWASSTACTASDAAGGSCSCSSQSASPTWRGWGSWPRSSS